MATYSLSRDTELYIAKAGATECFKLPILAGFSFSQSTGTQEISINEAGATPVRGQKSYNTSLNPVEVSFSTYIRPFVLTSTVADNKHSLFGVAAGATSELSMPLLAALFNSDAQYASTVSGWSAACSNANDSPTTASSVTTVKHYDSDVTTQKGTFYDLTNSAAHVTGKMDLYFKLDASTFYKVSDAVVNSVSIDLGIDGISTYAWTLQGRAINTVSSLPASVYTVKNTSGAEAISELPYLKTKLSSVAFTKYNANGTQGTVYNLSITGGSIEFTNNTTFLTPENLGVLNTPISSFTGVRGVSGNLTCYLKDSGNNSKALYQALLADINNITPRGQLVINIGGDFGVYPAMQLYMHNAKVSVPDISIDDVISLQFNFVGEGSDIDVSNELVVSYWQATAATTYAVKA